MIRILFLGASPSDEARLAQGKEVREIGSKLCDSNTGRRFDLVQAWAVRPTDLQKLFLRHSPDIVHFSGHGNAAGELLFEDDKGGARPAPIAAIGRLFKLLGRTVRCVVLNACFSTVQADAIRQHVDCLVGMKTTVSDDAAIAFASSFYLGLGHGQSVQVAFEMGCNQIDILGLAGADGLELVCRDGVDPAAVTFSVAAGEANFASTAGPSLPSSGIHIGGGASSSVIVQGSHVTVNVGGAPIPAAGGNREPPAPTAATAPSSNPVGSMIWDDSKALRDGHRLGVERARLSGSGVRGEHTRSQAAGAMLLRIDTSHFDAVVNEIRRDSRVSASKVKGDLKAAVEECLERLRERQMVMDWRALDAGGWRLALFSVEQAPGVADALLQVRTGYEHYSVLPLGLLLDELGAGNKAYEAVALGGDDIGANETRYFSAYREWHRRRQGSDQHGSFLLVTAAVARMLPPPVRRILRLVGRWSSDALLEWSLSSIRQRVRVSEFLDAIGQRGHFWFGLIPDVYVEPTDFRTIDETLRERRIVFLTGTPELGKTYTAVKLLWDYFLRGYEPFWFEGGEFAERTEVRRRLENIVAELRPRRIVYFEDPFGKTQYERREALERDIGSIIDRVQSVEDVFVLITSREEVFKAFKQERIAGVDLEAFERQLNLLRPSYGEKGRRAMMMRMAQACDCAWLRNKEQREFVAGALKGGFLPTPLSIRDFVIASSSVEDRDELRRLWEEKSADTARAFAHEIAELQLDKQLFLSFVFVGFVTFKTHFVESSYHDLLRELKMEGAPFEDVVAWFARDKVRKSPHGGFEFAHSSYHGALEHALKRNGRITRFNREAFGSVLLKISGSELGGESAVYVVDAQFENLEERVREGVLRNALAVSSAAATTAGVIIAHYTKVPADLQESVMKLAQTDWESIKKICARFAYQWSDLDGELANLRDAYLEHSEIAAKLGCDLVMYYRAPPPELLAVLERICEREPAATAIANELSKVFMSLSMEMRALLARLLEAGHCNLDTGTWLGMYWGYPDGEAAGLIDRFAGNEEFFSGALVSLSMAAGMVPQRKLTDRQIHTLTRSTPTEKQAGLLATVLVSYYDSLTEAARGYLRAFADDVDLAWALVLAVARHYNTVPEELRTVLSRHQLALQQIILNAPGTDEEHQVGEALSLIGNTWKRLNPIFRAEQLRRLSSHPNQTVAERARLLQQHGHFMAEHPGKSFWIMGDKIQVNGESEETGDWGLRPGRVRRRR